MDEVPDGNAAVDLHMQHRNPLRYGIAQADDAAINEQGNAKRRKLFRIRCDVKDVACCQRQGVIEIGVTAGALIDDGTVVEHAQRASGRIPIDRGD